MVLLSSKFVSTSILVNVKYLSLSLETSNFSFFHPSFLTIESKTVGYKSGGYGIKAVAEVY
jgi:hypothetical protein